MDALLIESLHEIHEELLASELTDEERRELKRHFESLLSKLERFPENVLNQVDSNEEK